MEQDIQKGKKKALVEAQDGVKDVAVIHQIYENMIYICVDSVLEKLQIHWDSRNLGDRNASNEYFSKLICHYR